MVQHLSGMHKAQCLIPNTSKVLWGREWDLNLVYNVGLHSCISCPHSMGILKYLLDLFEQIERACDVHICGLYP